MTAATGLPFRRKIVFVAIGVVVLALLAEGLARVTYRVIHHQPYRPGELGQLASGSWTFGTPAAARPEHLSHLVLHPYLGFAADAEGEDMLGLGFGDGTSPVESVEHRGDLRVLVLGGSVAFQLMTPDSQTGVPFLGDALTAALERADVDRRVWMFNASLPGFKQPQQLMAYSYLLSQGGEFDLVVNVDGFNEMTMAVIEEKPRGLHPAFPHGWDILLGNRWSPGRLRLAAELIELRRDQSSTIEWAQSAPWARSAIVGLYLARRIIAEEDRARVLIGTVERRRKQRELSFEEGGIPFDYDDPEQTCDYLAKLWRRSSTAIGQLARGNGAEYLHVFQPNQYLEGSKPLTDRERREFYRPDAEFGPAFRAAYPCFRREMGELTDGGEWFVDVSMTFAEEAETVYSDWCCHFNEYGLRQLAAKVAGEIVARPNVLSDP